MKLLRWFTCLCFLQSLQRLKSFRRDPLTSASAHPACCRYNMMHIFQSPGASEGLERNLCILMGLIKFQPPLPTSVGTVRETWSCAARLFIQPQLQSARGFRYFMFNCDLKKVSMLRLIKKGPMSGPALRGRSKVRVSAAAGRELLQW